MLYANYAKGFRPGGVNAPLPVATCGVTPSTYDSDTTQSYEIGSKSNLDNRFRLAASVYYTQWNGLQQNVYDPGPTNGCSFQYTTNLGTAVAKGFDLQADLALGGGWSLETSAGYTDARYTKSTSVAQAGDAISGVAAIDFSPGTSAPWVIAVGPQYAFHIADREAFVRADWEYTSRNPWLASVQDSRNATQYDQYVYTLPSTSFTSIRTGIKLGSWQVSAFVDNLFDSHPVLNYALGINDYNNPAGPPTPQQNDFTFRPRTIGVTATYRD